MAYLLDANVFIRAKNEAFGFDICPGFWDWLGAAQSAGRVGSVRAVLDELRAGHDPLADWAKACPDGFFRPPGVGDLAALREVARWTDESARYPDAAKQEFLSGADYYLVAQASAGHHTVVTHEVPSAGTKRIKIPDACLELGVEYATCWQMLRAEGARFLLAGVHPSGPASPLFENP